MTAQLVVMNKQAIAMASDSAVTLTKGTADGRRQTKIFTTANKLFSLTKWRPVGIMASGNAEFMFTPIEVLIKVYREFIDGKSYDTLGEYAQSFISFLDSDKSIFPEAIQLKHVRESVYSYFVFIQNEIRAEVQKASEKGKKLKPSDIESVTSAIIDQQTKLWDESKKIGGIPEKFDSGIVEKYNDVFDEALKSVFELLPLLEAQKDALKKIAVQLFSKYALAQKNFTGIVVAGFGDKDIFPQLQIIRLDGIANNKLKYRIETESKIGFDHEASLLPVAQTEMVKTFMEGIDPDYRRMEKGFFKQMVSEYAETFIKLLDKYSESEKKELKDKMISGGKTVIEELNKNLELCSKEQYVEPVVSLVKSLPKDELAAMAESLINLSSLKRRYSMIDETVGGAIDVALISKGDGFIWVKRKHYFKPELNPEYFERLHLDGGKYGKA